MRLPQLTAPESHVFLRCQGLKSQRPAHVETRSIHAHFFAQIHLRSGMQAGRSIHQHRAGIDLPDKSHGRAVISRHDRIGMPRAEGRDMGQRLRQNL